MSGFHLWEPGVLPFPAVSLRQDELLHQTPHALIMHFETLFSVRFTCLMLAGMGWLLHQLRRHLVSALKPINSVSKHHAEGEMVNMKCI